MLAAKGLSRAFSWKKILEIPGYERVVRRKKYINLAKILGSTLTTCFLFANEWYTLSTFGAMIAGIFFINRHRDPLFKNLILSMEVDDEDKSLARIKTLDGTFRLNVDSITSLTDVYPAYRALQSSKELFNSQNQKIAAFDGDSKHDLTFAKKALQNTRDDIVGHLGSINQGKTIAYHDFSDRFSFFFRQGNEVFFVGFPFTPDISFDPEELMRVLAGNKPLKPRRSVMLAQEDEKTALDSQEKLRKKLKGEPLQELPKTETPELPSNSPTVN